MLFCSTTPHPSPQKGQKKWAYHSFSIIGFPSSQILEKPEWVWKMRNLFISDLHLTCCQYPLGRIYGYQMGNKTKIIYK